MAYPGQGWDDYSANGGADQFQYHGDAQQPQYYASDFAQSPSFDTQQLPSQQQYDSFPQQEFVNPSQIFSQPQPVLQHFHQPVQELSYRQSLPEVNGYDLYAEDKPNVKAEEIVEDHEEEMIDEPIDNDKDLSQWHKVDRPQTLIALAEEYVTAAYSFASDIAMNSNPEDLDEYCKLISAGLGCMEAAMKSRKITPRVEAVVTLTYAGILFEETQNVAEAEQALAKGIQLCERNHIIDLKYGMQHLMSRILASKNPKAAIKFLDGIIKDAKALGHESWLYALRFLRATIFLDTTDYASAGATYASIALQADNNRDGPVFALASALEALTILLSGNHGSVMSAQIKLASARSQQLDDWMRRLPQISIFVELLDIVCLLLEGGGPKAEERLSALLKAIETRRSSGSDMVHHFSIALQPVRGQKFTSGKEAGAVLTNGVSDEIVLDWLCLRDVHALTYFVAGIAAIPSRVSQAEKHFSSCDQMLKSARKRSYQNRSLLAVETDAVDINILRFHSRFGVLFAYCSRTDWPAAQKAHKETIRARQSLKAVLPDMVDTLLAYIDGVIHQGLGDFEKAAAIFKEKRFKLQPTDQIKHSDPSVDFAILAAVNLIQLSPRCATVTREQVTLLQNNLEPYRTAHPNLNIRAAIDLVKAVGFSKEQLKDTKTYLGYALNGARRLDNKLLMCLVLNFMSARFFEDIVAQQAEKSAHAAYTMAKHSSSKLWLSVAEGWLAHVLETHGKAEEGRKAQDEAEWLAGQVLVELKPWKVNEPEKEKGKTKEKEKE